MSDMAGRNSRDSVRPSALAVSLALAVAALGCAGDRRAPSVERVADDAEEQERKKRDAGRPAKAPVEECEADNSY
jgi:hypothetical protein